MNDPSNSLNIVGDILTEAMRYWEFRRITYNVVLTIVVVAWLITTCPHFRPAITWHSLGLLLVLAVLANLCYTAAYFVDVPMQLSLFRANWRRWRWGLWLFGMLFAILLENYWIADEIYPYAAQ